MLRVPDSVLVFSSNWLGPMGISGFLDLNPWKFDGKG